MKNSSLVVLSCLLLSVEAKANLPEGLTNVFGNFTSVESEDYFCRGLEELKVSRAKNDPNAIVIEVSRENLKNHKEIIPGINTNKVYSVKSISSQVVKRHVFKNNKLKVQERSSFAGFLSSGFKDVRTVIKILDENAIEFGYTDYANCPFRRTP